MARTTVRRTVYLSLITIAVLAAACGDDDASVDVGDEPTVVPDGDGDTAAEPDGGDDDLPLGSGPYPIADLTFTVQPDGPDGASRTYRLACLGDTATFTGDAGTLDAPTACVALTDDAVRARLIVGPPADQICTEIYGGPQVAHVRGTLDDEPVDATIDRANGCGIDDYDVVLAALLSPAGS